APSAATCARSSSTHVTTPWTPRWSSTSSDASPTSSTERSIPMARLASVLKQGFYPAPPEAIAGILRHLKIPDPPPDQKFKPEDVNILDPCAGEARALVQLAEGLGVSKDHVFAIELNASRAAR